MSLNQLYQQEIKDHNQNPIGHNRRFAQTHHAEGYNPSCGDELSIYLKINQQQEIEMIGFDSDACAICTASASLLCEHAEGKNLVDIQQDIGNISQSLVQNTPLPYDTLSCLSPVSSHKSRVGCALLPWQTLAQALPNSVSAIQELSEESNA
ncbi:MAG: iron-sulfur cluster assembly scaffold protein [Kangiellaceae bacterium]|nr:iron-sulfur cluster assembly scaffold protein [Kangiellaceae bacterium]MCW8999984.1 iron-sulfur cluster assembly scaffold protein [Kangiellaceae bacterium]